MPPESDLRATRCDTTKHRKEIGPRAVRILRIRTVLRKVGASPGLDRSTQKKAGLPMDRRTFVSASAVAAAAALSSQRSQAAPIDRITVAAIGVRGRGGSVLRAFASRPNVDVKYVVDVDQSVRDRRAREVHDQTGKKPGLINDFRVALDDPAVDASAWEYPT